MITSIVYDSSLLELFTTGVSLNLMKIPVERIVITSPDYDDDYIHYDYDHYDYDHHDKNLLMREP